MNYAALIAISARLKEPSTHAALAAVLAYASLNVSDDLLQNILAAAAAVTAILGMILKEKATHTTIVVAPPMPPPVK